MLGFILLNCTSVSSLTSLLKLALAAKTSDGTLGSCFNVANSLCSCQLCCLADTAITTTTPWCLLTHHLDVSASGSKIAERRHISSLTTAAGSARCQQKLLVEVSSCCCSAAVHHSSYSLDKFSSIFTSLLYLYSYKDLRAELFFFFFSSS